VAGVALMALGWFPDNTVEAAAFCVAGVALGDIHLHFAWWAWHLVTSTFTLRGRCGTWCSAGALGSQMTPWRPRLFARQAWHLATSTFTLRGRRGTWRHPPSLCVVGMALGATFTRRVRR